MKIYSINCTNRKTNVQKNPTITFTSRVNKIVVDEAENLTQILKYATFLDKAETLINYPLNLLANAVDNFRYKLKPDKSVINKFYNGLKDCDKGSSEYISQLIAVHNYNGKSVSTFLDEKRINDLARSNESCIFVVNHVDPDGDDKVLSNFISNLYKKYSDFGKSKTCPRPYIISDERNIKILSKQEKLIQEKIGCVGVKADLGFVLKHHRSGVKKNNSALMPVIRDFSKDKGHIFIFPEGNLASVFDEKMSEQRFQTGIGRMIQASLKGKKTVKVVPLQLVYKDSDTAKIIIKSPSFFKKENGQITFSNSYFDEFKPLKSKNALVQPDVLISKFICSRLNH